VLTHKAEPSTLGASAGIRGGLERTFAVDDGRFGCISVNSVARPAGLFTVIGTFYRDTGKNDLFGVLNRKRNLVRHPRFFVQTEIA
jgi:hypothetical protein